jgi:hypothetical protein
MCSILNFPIPFGPVYFFIYYRNSHRGFVPKSCLFEIVYSVSFTAITEILKLIAANNRLLTSQLEEEAKTRQT